MNILLPKPSPHVLVKKLRLPSLPASITGGEGTRLDLTRSSNLL